MPKIMQKNTFVEEVDGKECKLVLLFAEKETVSAQSVEALKSPENIEALRGLQMRNGPDNVLISITSKGEERRLGLTGEEYQALRRLFQHDIHTIVRF